MPTSQSNKNRSARIENSKDCQLLVSYASRLAGAAKQVGYRAVQAHRHLDPGLTGSARFQTDPNLL